jgi:hypothetical protein
MRLRRLLLLVLLGAAPARAHSVSNEVALGLNEDTPASPHGTHVADQLTLRFDLDDDWTLKLGGAYTYDAETAPPEGTAFGTSSAQILNAVAGVEWDASARVSLYLDVQGSPRASQTFGSVFSITAGGVTVPVDVELFNATSSIGVVAGVSFTLGGHEVLGTVLGGTVLDLSVGWTLLSIQQHIDGIIDRNGNVVARSALEAYCRLFPSNWRCRALMPALKGGEDTLNQVSLSLAVLQPLGSTTELDLSGSVDFYDKDPATAGFFTYRAFQAATGSLGAGFPLAPVLFTLSPMVQQEVGAWTLAPWYQFIDYASGLGYAHVAGLRVSVRIGEAWTVWVSGSAQWDNLSTDPSNNSTTLVTSGRVALGFRARF